ncbi:Unknown protein sequence [Pseudomonas amygdali pv. ulmi]|uniref:Uncharacterized protein n=1 Tax=Pseudomonas amygdali pv. ulmi TaxID=251720 RepID=A0A0Q0EA34_PSEA0|nr:Unknown protein sequence [Pseudomonas amygdali pv. ulmi]
MTGALGFALVEPDGYERQPKAALPKNHEKRQVNIREPLIYSIFRPGNALEALIYLGATAGF